jgi:hypothetical protein
MRPWLLMRQHGIEFDELQPQIMHRVYRLDRARASELFGKRVAEAIPDEGLVDVHRYLTAEIKGQRIVIDATFSGPPWDGNTSPFIEALARIADADR